MEYQGHGGPEQGQGNPTGGMEATEGLFYRGMMEVNQHINVPQRQQQGHDLRMESGWSRGEVGQGQEVSFSVPAVEEQQRLTFYAAPTPQDPGPSFQLTTPTDGGEAGRDAAFDSKRIQMEMEAEARQQGQSQGPLDLQQFHGLNLSQSHHGGVSQVRNSLSYYNYYNSYSATSTTGMMAENCMRRHPPFREPLLMGGGQVSEYYGNIPAPNPLQIPTQSHPGDFQFRFGQPYSPMKMSGPPPNTVNPLRLVTTTTTSLQGNMFKRYEETRAKGFFFQQGSSPRPPSALCSPLKVGCPPRGVASVIQVNPCRPRLMSVAYQTRNPYFPPKLELSKSLPQGKSVKQNKKSIAQGFVAAAASVTLNSSNMTMNFDPTSPPRSNIRAQWQPGLGGVIPGSLVHHGLPSFNESFSGQPRSSPITEVGLSLLARVAAPTIPSPPEKKKRAPRGKAKKKQGQGLTPTATEMEVGGPGPAPTPQNKKTSKGKGSNPRSRESKSNQGSLKNVQVVNLFGDPRTAGIDKVSFEESTQPLPGQERGEDWNHFNQSQPTIQDATATVTPNFLGVLNSSQAIQQSSLSTVLSHNHPLEEGQHSIQPHPLMSLSSLQTELLAVSTLSELNPSQLGISSIPIPAKSQEPSSPAVLMETELSPTLGQPGGSQPVTTAPSSSPSSGVSILVKKRGRGSTTMNKNKKSTSRKRGNRPKSNGCVDTKDASLSPISSSVGDGKIIVPQDAKKWFPSPQEQKELYGNGCFVMDVASVGLKPMSTTLYRIFHIQEKQGDGKTLLLQIYSPVDLSGREFHRATGEKKLVNVKDKILFTQYYPVYCLKIIDTDNISVFHYLNVDRVTPNLLAIRVTARLFSPFRTMMDLIFRQVIYGDDFIKQRIEPGSSKYDSVYQSSWDSHEKETQDRVKELLQVSRLPEGFIKPFCFYPNLRFIRLEREREKSKEQKIPCAICVKRSKRVAAYKTSFKKERYDPLSFQGESDPKSGDNLVDKNDEGYLCVTCKNLVQLMWRLIHHRWYIYATIRGYVADLVIELDSDEKLDPDETIDSLLKDYEWMGKSFVEYQVLLADADREIKTIKTENMRRRGPAGVKSAQQ